MNEEFKEYLKDKSASNDAFKFIYKEILSKYEELTKDKIVLVLDKEEAERLYNHFSNSNGFIWTDEFSQGIRKKCKEALNK
jgi:hypothetical protein